MWFPVMMLGLVLALPWGALGWVYALAHFSGVVSTALVWKAGIMAAKSATKKGGNR